jgi:hypothetical protein
MMILDKIKVEFKKMNPQIFEASNTQDRHDSTEIPQVGSPPDQNIVNVRERDSDKSLMMSLYLVMFLVEFGPRKFPPELTNSLVGEKITQAVEAMF